MESTGDDNTSPMIFVYPKVLQAAKEVFISIKVFLVAFVHSFFTSGLVTITQFLTNLESYS